MQVQSLGWEDPLEEGMATHSSVLAWRTPMERGAWRAAVYRAARIRQDWRGRAHKHRYLLKESLNFQAGACSDTCFFHFYKTFFSFWALTSVYDYTFTSLSVLLEVLLVPSTDCPPFSLCQSTLSVQFSRSVVSNSATPWTAGRQASLSITNSWSLPKLMCIKSVMPSNHLILCRPLLLLSSIFPSIRVFSNESALLIRWPKYWSFSFNISPSNEHPGLTCSNRNLIRDPTFESLS